jgi:hypothetical protein
MKKTRLSSIFPSTTIAAYYDQVHQLINISKYNYEDFKTVKLSNITKETAEKISLFEHELMHFIDHFSTLWGQQNITLLFNAINAYANQEIDDFWRIKYLDNKFRKDSFFHYFSEKHNHIVGNEDNKWHYSISSGVRFTNEGRPNNEKPILFVRFSSKDNKPISRVPMSVASILETNAIKAEFSIKANCILLDEDPVSKIIRQKNLKKEIIGLLYHPDLTLYSVIAHLTANLNDDDNIFSTLETTSAIGTFVLNFPNELYSKLKIPIVNDKIWEERYVHFISDKDIGATYYFLLKNLIDQNGKKSFSEELILSSSNLPKADEVFEIVLSKMLENKQNLIEGPFKNMAIKMLDKGIEMFKKRGLFGTNSDFRKYIVENKLFPTVIFGDTILKTENLNADEILEKVKKGEEISVHEKYFIMDYYDSKFMEFNEVCGV